ncbi:MAG TPA: exodeoxyribonuclease VII small subunit [Pirellulales bacterium]|nr:exodeoxyribonuclease VII small subunit [Pirellulales bacterium]
MLTTMPKEQDSESPDTESPCPPSFEQALAQLETIVHELEEGEIGLADALDRYELGIKLLKQCYGLLERAERRIELLSGVDAAGNPVTQPFSDESLSLEEKAQSRGRRRTRAGDNPDTPNSLPPPQLPKASMDEGGILF